MKLMTIFIIAFCVSIVTMAIDNQAQMTSEVLNQYKPYKLPKALHQQAQELKKMEMQQWTK